ncbi:proteasome inhibitor PI31 subunit [Drosophila takahashii]|uniref:proteasome inhibitor PI31 subunit n=1 Tax=Drosophila takahashii TaxID=29030 RepID=UPI001CF85F9F|nr:proteasome inhibitor PI31 subunit [Drosophila takahashii]
METPDTTSSLSHLSEISLKSLGIGVAGKSGKAEIDSLDWHLLFHSIRPNIRKKSDLLIALIHLLVTKEYRLRGATKAEAITNFSGRQMAGGSGSDLLPQHWNRDAHRYSLNYVDELGSQYVLMAKLSRRDLVISLQNSTSKRMSIACLQPENLVMSTTRSSFGKCLPGVEKIMQRLRFDLVDPAVRGVRKRDPLGLRSVATSSRLTFQHSKSIHALASEESS